jgi:APA family basic amino acid/polyamine antiporter
MELLFGVRPGTLERMTALSTSSSAGLRRELGLPGAVALGVGGTIGGGIYVLVGRAAGVAGPAALISFALAFGAALLIALPYAELACRYPLAGGGYAFARSVFGQRVGFLMGWTFWGAYLFISGYVTLGFGGYLHAMAGTPPLLGALGVIAGSLALNLLGLRVSGAVQGAVISAAVLGLLAFALAGIPHLHARNYEPFLPHGARGVVTAALLAFLAFGGFDMVAAAGEEVRQPERNLPRAILITLGTVLAIYLLVCLVAIGVLGAAPLGASRAPLADAAQHVGGARLRAALTCVALLSTAATANAVLVVTSRISYAMARDGLLPRQLASVSTRSGAPWATLLTCGVLLAAVAAAGSIGLAASAGGFLYVLHFVLPLLAVVALRRRRAPRPPGGMTTPRPRLTLPLALVACGVLLSASGVSGAAAGAAWLAFGAFGYSLA